MRWDEMWLDCVTTFSNSLGAGRERWFVSKDEPYPALHQVNPRYRWMLLAALDGSLSLFDVIDDLRVRSGLSDLICLCLTWLDWIVNFDVSRFVFLFLFCNWVVMNLWLDHVFVCCLRSVLNWTFLRYAVRSWFGLIFLLLFSSLFWKGMVLWSEICWLCLM